MRTADDPAQAAELREVYTALAELPEEFRDALVAVDIAGLTTEAARALRIPEGTLTSRMFRARDRMARRLGGEDQRRPCSALGGSGRCPSAPPARQESSLARRLADEHAGVASASPGHR